MAPRDSLELASLASSTHISQSLGSPASRAPSSRKLSFSDDDPLGETAELTAATRGERSYSVGSTFDFGNNFYPLASTAAGGYAALGGADATVEGGRGANGGSLEKRKTLTYMNGLSLVIGLIIGSGIFSSPAQVNTNAGSPGASLLVWVIAGLLAWTGAASYAELGGAIPLNGGAQAYLSKIFGEWAGFLFTWTSVCVLKPGSAAIMAIILGEYMVQAIVGAHITDVNPWVSKGVALIALGLVTFLSCISTKLGMKSASMFLFLKFFALLAVTVIGIVVAITGFSWDGAANTEWKTRGWFEGTSTSVANWAVAIYAGLWAFDGWDNTNYVAGEFKNTSRDLPRVIHTSLLAVIISYIAANLAYFFVLPSAVINSTNTVAVAFGTRVFGRIGGLIFALLVSGSCFGALNAHTFTAGRLVYVAGKEGYFPSVFGRIGIGSQTGVRASSATSAPRRAGGRLAALLGDDDAGLFYTPVYAMMLNAGLCACYIIVGEFATLITFYGVAGYTFYFATVLGLIVLRIREPGLERPYRTWITTPIIFCCVSLFLLSRAVFAHPGQTLVVVAFVAAGVPVYWWRVGRHRGRKGGLQRGFEAEEKGSGWKFWKRWGRS